MENKEAKTSTMRVILVTLTALVLAVGVAGAFLYQLHRAETGRSSLLPVRIRTFVAARVYHAAQKSPYESDQLSGYVKVVSLDPVHFPGAWRYLCDHYTKYGQLDAASVSCARAVELGGKPHTTD